MTSRDRFAAAMQHRAPDRVPLDLGGTPLTGMRPACLDGLRELLGFSKPAPDEPGGSSGIDERILDWAGADFRCVGYLPGLPSPLKRRISPTARVNEWGVRSDRIDGEWQITESPLRGASRADLDAFPWPEPRIDDAVLAGWERRAKEWHDDGRFVVVAGHPVFGVLELGCWMCGYDDFLLRMALEPDFVRAFFDKVWAVQAPVIEQYYAALGPHVDLTTSGDDFGTQNGPLVSPAMFDDLIAPVFAERVRRTKERAGCFYWHHSCGSVAGLLDRIIDCGVDILNPVQTSAAEMDPQALKNAAGDRLVFWGAVDVQQFLPRATPDEIESHIAGLIGILGRNGGYVIAPAHEIQDDVPPENVAAWIETARRSRGRVRRAPRCQSPPGAA
jgi:uroporphyrinogen decarboxylase